MAYRRKQGLSRSSTFQEDVHDSPSSPIGPEQNNNNTLRTCYSFSPSSASSSSAAPSLAAQAIRATAARHGSVNPSLSFAHGDSALAASDHLALKGLEACGDEAGIGESKSGFWGVLAQKAKTILEEDMMSPRAYDMHEGIVISHPLNNTSINPAQLKNHATLKGLGTITSPLNHEGRTMMMMENNNKSAGDVRSQIKLKGSGDGSENSNVARPQLANTQTNHETQLKASRDVAMATAAKAKLLLRELKTVKADLAFAKARCAQLEEENKLLRDKEGREKGQNRADDDLIRLQLETLLAEKARLANENEIYSRENRFLREIVEYHQLTMQDVLYFDEEGMEDMEEDYPIDSENVTRMLSVSSTPVQMTPSSSPPRNSKPQPQENKTNNNISVSQHDSDTAK